jgi:hypothetical protein
MNPNPPQQSELTRDRLCSYEVGAAKVELARVTDTLVELYQLLEDYAPTWYLEHHHKKAESALRVLKKLLGANA